MSKLNIENYPIKVFIPEIDYKDKSIGKNTKHYNKKIVNNAVREIENLRSLGHDMPLDALIAVWHEIAWLPYDKIIDLQKKIKSRDPEILKMPLIKFTILQIMLENKSIFFKAEFMKAMTILSQNYIQEVERKEKEVQMIKESEEKQKMTIEEWHKLKTHETTKQIQDLTEKHLNALASTKN